MWDLFLEQENAEISTNGIKRNYMYLEKKVEKIEI